MRKDIFAGIGLGLLVGTIIGLSIAQVTGIILAALTSLLATFFGLKDTKDEGSKSNPAIIGTFGFSCLFSILLGIYIRTHDALAPSLTQRTQDYKKANFSDEEIKKIVLFKDFGIVPQGYTFSKDAKEEDKGTHSVLMSGESDKPYLCDAISGNETLQEVKKAYDATGGTYQQIEQHLTRTISDSAELRKTLIDLSSLLCHSEK